MHRNIITCFAVIYIPFYALQCARQKWFLEKMRPGETDRWINSFLTWWRRRLHMGGEPGVFDDCVI